MRRSVVDARRKRDTRDVLRVVKEEDPCSHKYLSCASIASRYDGARCVWPRPCDQLPGPRTGMICFSIVNISSL